MEIKEMLQLPATALKRIVETFYSTSSTPSGYTGRVVVNTQRWRSSWSGPTHDWSRPDYVWWREAAFARLDGLDLSGLFIRPIVDKVAAWTLGRSPKWKLDSPTATVALNDWWSAWHPIILKTWREALTEGDAYILIHPDASIGVLPPESIEPIVSEDDYSEIVGYRSSQVLTNPDTAARMIIEDEWTETEFRRRTSIDGVLRTQRVWSNPISGLVPIVHVANRPLSNQTYGHPECEALVPLFHKYGEVLDAAIEGNVLQGRPTPVLTFETVQDLEAFDADNASVETQQLPDGTTQTVKTYDLDLSQLMVASGANFRYEAPGPFVGDTERILGLLFYLMLEHSELPEFIFGNAIASSKASADVQMPIFIEYIQGRRSEMVGWLTDIASIAAAYLNLTTPTVGTGQRPQAQWEPLDQQDGLLTLETIKWAYLEGLIDARTALMMSPVDFEDIDQLLNAARKERDDALAQSDAQLEAAVFATTDDSDVVGNE